MLTLVGNQVNFRAQRSLLIGVATMLLLFAACNKQQSASAPSAPKAFASPEEAGKALADAAKTQNQNEVGLILGPGLADITATGDATQDKAALAGFARAYQMMNRGEDWMIATKFCWWVQTVRHSRSRLQKKLMASGISTLPPERKRFWHAG